MTPPSLPTGAPFDLTTSTSATQCEGPGCEARYHTYCLDPPLDAVPAGKWLCHMCDPHPADLMATQVYAAGGPAHDQGGLGPAAAAAAAAPLAPAAPAPGMSSTGKAAALRALDAVLHNQRTPTAGADWCIISPDGVTAHIAIWLCDGVTLEQWETALKELTAVYEQVCRTLHHATSFFVL